jgi:prepilin peptidase CpaA
MDWLQWEMWCYGVLAVALVVSAVTDVRSGKIRNYVTYPAIAIGLIGHTLTSGIWQVDDMRLGLVGALAGLGAGFVPMLLAYMAGGIGGGDAKLMGAVGALAGWRFVVAAMFYGFAVAAVMALYVMLKKRVARRTLLRVLRFALLLATPSRPADPATADSPKVAFGLALCIGAALALLEALLRGPMAGKILPGI